MNLSKNILSAIIGCIFFLSACQKDVDYFVPDPQPPITDTNWVSPITAAMPVSKLRDSLQLQFSSDSILINDSIDTRYISPTGLAFTFQRNSIRGNSFQQVSGAVSIKTLFLKKKGDFIRMGTSTLSNRGLLTSGAAFFAQLVQYSMQLRLDPNKVFSVTVPTTATRSGSNLFYGNNILTAPQVWESPLDSVANRVFLNSQGYSVYSRSLGWINIVVPFAPGSLPQITVEADIDRKFTNANTFAYLVINNSLTVLPMNGEVAIKKFRGGLLPARVQCKLIVLSKIEGQYFTGIESFTTALAPGTIVQSIRVSPTVTNLQGIIALLEGL